MRHAFPVLVATVNQPRPTVPHALSVSLFVSALLVAGCVTQQPPTDTSVSSVTGPSPVAVTPTPTPTTPTTGTPTPTPTPTPTTTVTVAYVQDMAAIFSPDCTRCHSGSRPDAGYSMSTYAQVMRAVAAGNARSALVVVTQRNASMYRYWSGNAASKADLVRRWVVDNQAAQTR